MADINGILNVLLEIGILAGKIIPFAIWHCGTVGDIKGYLTPFENFGEFRTENPFKVVKLGSAYAVCYPCGFCGSTSEK